jgi:tetratricopeptide (TPR) repeat protein
MTRRAGLARIAAIAAVLVTSAAPLAAQRAVRRPELAQGADTNDWEAYYDDAVDLLQTRRPAEAEAAFYWAARLEPRRAEPLFGQVVAYFTRDPRRLLDYIGETPHAEDVPGVRRADSLVHEAVLRNPMVFQGLIAIAYDQFPGDWADNPVTIGWRDYAGLDFSGATRSWDKALRQEPRKREWLHFDRALAFVGLHAYDSARAELTSLVATLRARQEKHLLHIWESTAFLEYAIGRLQAAVGNRSGAIESLQQALVEDLGFYQAHITLAELAIDRGDVAGATREYAQAIELWPNDCRTRFEYGVALSRGAALPEAETQLREAIRLEPQFADSYYELGQVLQHRGDSKGALDTFKTYVARAPRSSPNLTTARQLVEQLTQVVRADTTR